jgi:hypothetical protein
MNTTNSRRSILSGLGALARRIVTVLRECQDAQRRMAAVSSAPDRYIAHPDAAPDTYAEFLFRTSGPLLHEPSARSRARAQGALR